MINEEVKSIALKCTFLHKDIYEITEDGEVIGYLKQTENNNPPVSVLTFDGKDVGDYCCHEHACIAAYETHRNVDKTTCQLVSTGMMKSKIAAMLLASAFAETITNQIEQMSEQNQSKH